MSHKGFSHIGLSTLDLDKTREFYKGVLWFKPVVAHTIKIKEGGRIRHMFFDIGRDQLIAFMEPHDILDLPQNTIRGSIEGSAFPQLFYHFAFEAVSEAALLEKRNELRAKNVEVTEIFDHGWSKSIYFKDPNRLSLQYCCVVRNLTKDDATMQQRFTVRRAALDLSNATSAEVSGA